MDDEDTGATPEADEEDPAPDAAEEEEYPVGRIE